MARYWVGGAGTWNNQTTHWSATSGGAAGASVPTLNDDVIFDQNSGSGSYVITFSPNAQTTCRNFTMSNCSGTITSNPNGVLQVYGTAFTLDPTGTFDPTNYPQVNFNGAAGCSITCSSQSFGNVAFNGGNSAVYNLLDNFHAFDFSSQIAVNSGTINANNHNVNVGHWRHLGTGTKVLNMGSGLWSLSGNAISNPNVWLMDQHTTLNKGTANIILTNDGSPNRTCAGGGFTYNKLTIGAAAGNGILTILGSNTFSELASIKTGSHTIIFGTAEFNNFGAFTVSGSAGNIVTIQSSSGTQTNLVKTSDSDYWYVGAHSIDGGGNTNIVFTAGAGIDYLNFTNIHGFPAVPPPSSGSQFLMFLR